MNTATSTTTDPTPTARLFAELDQHLEKAARAGCSCDTSARETAMHLRRAIRALSTIVLNLEADLR